MKRGAILLEILSLFNFFFFFFVLEEVINKVSILQL